jgi:hypothetical protein
MLGVSNTAVVDSPGKTKFVDVIQKRVRNRDPSESKALHEHKITDNEPVSLTCHAY